MKKAIAILFVLLYTASFSGMLWAKDCNAGETLNASLFDVEYPCSATEGHTASGSEAHPLFQFCKLVETHKSVVVAKQLQLNSPYATTVESTYPSPAKLHTNDLKLVSYTTTISSNQLYLHYRVLLI